MRPGSRVTVEFVR
jgi:hypothetical protein